MTQAEMRWRVKSVCDECELAGQGELPGGSGGRLKYGARQWLLLA
jgi:hypothetical protein